MLNFLGAAQNFSVLAESKWQCSLRFVDEVTGGAADLDGVTFSGRVMVRDTVYDMTLARMEAMEEGNMVVMLVPPLPEGRWRYEVCAVAETGERSRLIYGVLSAIGLEQEDEGMGYAGRTLELGLPGDVNKILRTEWKHQTAAELAAKQATEAAKGIADLKHTAQDALDRATVAVGQLEGLDEKVLDATSAAGLAKEYKDMCQGIADNLPTRYVPEIGANGNWWINGVDRGVPAAGRDGRDGADLLRVMLNSAEELPEVGDGSTVYYVPRGDGACDCYVWVWADAGMQGGQWAMANEPVSLPVPVATVSVSGTLKLGSASVVTRGAPLAGNADGQAFVPPATSADFGSVKLSVDGVVSDGLRIGVDGNGAIVCEATTLKPATLTSHGTVMLGSRCTVMERVPYLLSIATNDGGNLCNNMVRNGALQHRTRAGWEPFASHMPWMDTETMTGAAYDYYLALHTSGQFSQSETQGLVLLPATQGRVGGVTVNGEGHEVYTKPMVDAKESALNSAIAQVRNIAEHNVKANATLMSIQVLTESAYDALTSLSSNTLYVVYPD